MRKFCFAFVFALLVCCGSCFALSSDDCPDLSCYSFSSNSFGYRLVDSASSVYASNGWTDSDRNYLIQIRNALTNSSTGTILGYLDSILSKSHNIFSKLTDIDIKLTDIERSTDFLQNINNNSNSILSYLRSDLNGPVIRDLLTGIENNSNDISSRFEYLWTNAVVPHFDSASSDPSWHTTILNNMGYLASTLLYDDFMPWNGGAPSLYGMVHRLQKTLASDEDIALSEAQKANRVQIEQDFVSGSSGKTSLGASDFGDLSSVGGSVKDSISLNGQSSISGFTGGLSDANEAGQGWFSAETRDALDSVSSSSSYGLKREKGNSDIYNMSGFSDHYSWLYGD